MSSIHAHEVMQFMLESATPFTREKLLGALTERYGADAEFHSCSVDGMSLPRVIEFLEQRGKFIPEGDGFVTHESKMCSH